MSHGRIGPPKAFQKEVVVRVRAGIGVLILVLPALAGCLGSDRDSNRDDGDAMDEGSIMPVLEVAIDPSDCRLGGLVLLASFDWLGPHLPPGFTARDAQAVLGTPVPTGQGAVLIFHLDCLSTLLGAGYQAAEFLIAVESPNVDVVLEPATLDLYAAGLAVAAGPLRDVVQEAGWDLLPDETQLEVGGLPLAPSARASYGVSSSGWSFAVTSPTHSGFANLERIWTATPAGLIFIENDYKVDAYLGVPQCTFAAGSPWAEVLGRPSCGLGDVGAVIPEN